MTLRRRHERVNEVASQGTAKIVKYIRVDMSCVRSCWPRVEDRRKFEKAKGSQIAFARKHVRTRREKVGRDMPLLAGKQARPR